MSDVRIVYDNAVDRGTLSASSTAGSMSVTNLAIDKKSNVWRSANGTSATLSAVWASLEAIGCVALPFCNLSPTATMRVRLTNEVSTQNWLTFTNTFTASAWAKTSVTTTTAVASPDGGSSATTLTASAANASIAQTVTLAVGTYTGSIWVRRRTGTGAVSLRDPGNTSWTPITITSAWQRFSIGATISGSSGTLQLQIATSGDAIDVAYAQLESGSVATSYYAGTRPLGYIDSWQSYSYDSGDVLCCPEAPRKLRGWTSVQSASAYAYGGGACARVWVPQINAYGLSVTIIDTNNLQGYIEASRMVAGPYWSTSYNASSINFGYKDSTTVGRAESGDQTADVGTIYKTMSVNLNQLPAADQAQFLDLCASSKAYPIFVSMFSANADKSLERNGLIYGRRTKDSELALNFAFNYTTSVELESI
jgi:hypothetical protein